MRDLSLQDFDFYEIHEAFAGQVLCTLKAWDDPAFCREKFGLPGPLGTIDRAQAQRQGRQPRARPSVCRDRNPHRRHARQIARREQGKRGLDFHLHRRRHGRHGHFGALIERRGPYALCLMVDTFDPPPTPQDLHHGTTNRAHCGGYRTGRPRAPEAARPRAFARGMPDRGPLGRRGSGREPFGSQSRDRRDSRHHSEHGRGGNAPCDRSRRAGASRLGRKNREGPLRTAQALVRSHPPESRTISRR